MSSFRSRPEETDGQHAQFWNLAGIDQSFTAYNLSLDQRSLLSVEDFDHDVDQSVVSSNGWGTNNNPAFVSPPTSTYSHSNPGDYTNTTCNQFYTTDAAYKWGCDQAIGADYIGGDGQYPLTIDPRPERLEDVFADDYTYPGPGPSIPPIDQPSYLDPSFLGDGMDMGNIGPDLEETHLEPPKIMVEDTGDTGGMEPWLNGMYTPGLGIANNKIPPQAGPSSASAGTLGVTHRHREPADDQVTESSVNTSHTSHSCRTCSKNFGNKDDLR
ncbi:hypothetical protein SLS58_008417 [Diplodia intermedia]|uniref:C2H2-type domain-containing protein n=1 Tax=Diplodia intermedia TaxID=856260 RepID=A0ABR3THF2_9PEZI